MPKNLGVDTFPDPVSHFGFHLAAIMDFAGVAVSGCGDRVPPSPLGWYYIYKLPALNPDPGA